MGASGFLSFLCQLENWERGRQTQNNMPVYVEREEGAQGGGGGGA